MIINNISTEQLHTMVQSIDAAVEKANTALAGLSGCWIDFTDENGNPTDEPYIHWLEEVSG